MKKVWALGALLGILMSNQAFSKDKEEGDAKLPTPKQVSSEMAEVWCAKMDECAKEKEMTVGECQKILFSSFKKGYDKIPKEQPLKVERSTLDQCKETVSKGTCESLKGSKSLPGCEFISLLGQ